MEKQIDRAIQQHPTTLLVLSENSIMSDWVEHEVKLARKVALDDSWEHSSWSKVLMEQVMKYYIPDHSSKEDNNEFERIFVRLVDGLSLYYKKDE